MQGKKNVAFVVQWGVAIKRSRGRTQKIKDGLKNQKDAVK